MVAGGGFVVGAFRREEEVAVEAVELGIKEGLARLSGDGRAVAIGIEVGASIPASRLIRVLEQLITVYGRPAPLRLDKARNSRRSSLPTGARPRRCICASSRPGKPDQNAFIERSNRAYRDEVLNAYVFASLTEMQAVTDEWLLTYNDRRPHEALGHMPPTCFLPRPPTPSESTCAWCP